MTTVSWVVAADGWFLRSLIYEQSSMELKHIELAGRLTIKIEMRRSYDENVRKRRVRFHIAGKIGSKTCVQ